MVDKLDWIWMDGEMVRWEDARVHILTHTIHYGTGAFEGIRAYRRASGETQVFRLREHIERLFDSAKMLQLKMPFTREQVISACLALVRANETESCYLRPLVFLGDEAMGLYAPNNTVHVSVVSWRWGAYLGDEALKKGIRAKVSSYARGHINATMAKGKISGHYVNSILAKREAKSGGYDEAIMLDTQGYVAEASGENLFMVKNGEIRTPDLGGPSSRASPATRSSPSRARWGSRSPRGASPATSSGPPTRCSSRAPPRSSPPCARSTTAPWARAPWGPSPSGSRPASSTS
jgi:branched-chain amino acid aminotransferase